MKTTKQIMKEGIEQLKGKVKIGDIISQEYDGIAYKLSDIINGVAICTIPNDGITKSFPVDEIYNVYELKQVCLDMKIREALFVDRNN